MSNFDIQQRTSSWRQLIQDAAKRRKVDKATFDQLHAHLREVIEAGRTETGPSQRHGLQALARTMADDIFRLTKEYPSAVIAPLSEPRQEATGSPRIAPSRLFRGKNSGSALLMGRKRELASLDAAWDSMGKKRIV